MSLLLQIQQAGTAAVQDTLQQAANTLVQRPLHLPPFRFGN